MDGSTLRFDKRFCSVTRTGKLLWYNSQAELVGSVDLDLGRYTVATSLANRRSRGGDWEVSFYISLYRMTEYYINLMIF